MYLGDVRACLCVCVTGGSEGGGITREEIHMIISSEQYRPARRLIATMTMPVIPSLIVCKVNKDLSCPSLIDMGANYETELHTTQNTHATFTPTHIIRPRPKKVKTEKQKQRIRGTNTPTAITAAHSQCIRHTSRAGAVPCARNPASGLGEGRPGATADRD